MKTQKSKEPNTSKCSLLLQTLCSQLSFKVCNVGQGKGWGTASLISRSWLIVQFQSQFLRNAGGSGLGMRGTRQEWGMPLFSFPIWLGPILLSSPIFGRRKMRKKRRDLKKSVYWQSLCRSLEEILYFYFSDKKDSYFLFCSFLWFTSI